ncbi:hypothetical protein VTO73DRAFT_9641 [Trametes versicolor]
MRAMGIGSLAKWVDDNVFLQILDIDWVSEHLGIPWQVEKDHPFAASFPFTSFVWNLDGPYMVAIPRTKADKYIRAIDEWSSKCLHSLREVQQLHGKLWHASLVVPQGRAYLINIKAMLGIYNNFLFLLRTPPSQTPADIQWWRDAFSQATIERPIPGPHPIWDPAAFSNTSSVQAGSYSSSAINNYVTGVRAWHIMHGLPWTMNELRYEAALTGAGQLTPPSSTRPKRDLITINLLMQIEALLDISQPEDTAIWACTCVTFFSLARLGELTVQTQRSHKASEHPSRQSVHVVKHRDGSIMRSIHLPITKTSPKGEDILFAKQVSGGVDPWEALNNHFAVNNLKDLSHLFTYRKQPSNLEPSVAQIAGHSFRICGTLEYLLRGLSFETVKAIGRWKSDAFTLYLRKHAQILAPYLQDEDKLLERFSQLTIQLPPVR